MFITTVHILHTHLLGRPGDCGVGAGVFSLRPALHLGDLVARGGDEALAHAELGAVDAELGRVLLHDLHSVVEVLQVPLYGPVEFVDMECSLLFCITFLVNWDRTEIHIQIRFYDI